MTSRSVGFPSPPGAAVAGGGSVEVKIASNLWMTWYYVAADHAAQAAEARERSINAPDGSHEMGVAFQDEFHAALVAITASAFAVDAWALAVEDQDRAAPRPVPEPDEPCDPPPPRSGRAGAMTELLKSRFDLGRFGAQWGKQIKRLFQLRVSAVHFRSEFFPPQPHPTGKSNVSSEQTIYTAEEARRSVVLALEVVSVCIAQPRPQFPETAKWCSEIAHVPGALRDAAEVAGRYR